MLSKSKNFLLIKEKNLLILAKFKAKMLDAFLADFNKL